MDGALPRFYCSRNQRSIQIQPTLWGGRTPVHCYSDCRVSDVSLEPAILCTALADAAELGYTIASFSGAEPFFYPALEFVLAYAKSRGLQVSVTTSGTVFAKQELPQLSGLVDVLLINLDGPPGPFSPLRSSARTFEVLLARLEQLRGDGVRFGFVQNLTRQNWEQTVWLAEFAAEQQAVLLQLHPVEIVAREGCPAEPTSPGEEILARDYLLALALWTRYNGRLTVQFDAFRWDYVREHPEAVFASDLEWRAGDRQPAELLSPIVMEADGTVVPVRAGFSRDYALCNLNKERLTKAWPRYAQQGYPAFRSLCRNVFQEADSAAKVLVDWYDLIVSRSHAPRIAALGAG